MNRWSVRKRNGQWRVYSGDSWHDTFETIWDATTYATQSAVADILYAPGGLSCLKLLKQERTLSQ